jgi:predicted XRE-type DNA-binding protein
LIEANVKSDLWRDLVAHIAPLQLTQKELAKRLGVHQPEVSNLLNGKLSKFSVGSLIHYGARLDLGFEGKFTTPQRGSVRTLHAKAKHTRSKSEALAAAGAASG